jgi:hypothetical protein
MEIYCKFAAMTILVIKINQILIHVCHTNGNGWIFGMGINLGQKEKRKVQNQLL